MTTAAPAPATLLAHVIDPEAFEVHPIEERRQAAAVQWAARRHVAYEHATHVLTSDWLAGQMAAARAGAFHDLMTYLTEREWFRLAEDVQDALRYVADGPADIRPPINNPKG